MNLNQFLRALTLGLLVSITLAPLQMTHAASSNSTIARLEDQIRQHQIDLQQLKQEYSSARSKRQEAEEKVDEVRQEINEKKRQLALMKDTVGGNPSSVQREAIANEQKRLTLAEIGITTQEATLDRFQKKESEISRAISKKERLIDNARHEIKQVESAERSKIEADTERLALELQKLKQENEKLRLSMEIEAQRAALAQAEAEAAARAAARTEARQATQNIPEQRLPDNMPQQASNQTNEADLSQTVLPGELPIYLEDSDATITLRSRTLEEAYPMRRVDRDVYEAEVVINPGTDKVYFDVKNRRYRGRFPQTDKSITYVFSLDTSREERPKLGVRLKEAEQVANAESGL